MSIQWNSVFKHFAPLALVLFICGAMVSAATQQVLRLSANDALVDQADSIALTLSKQSAKGQQSNTKINVEESSALFVIIIDKDGTENYSSMQVDGKTPKLPEGTINTANDKKINKVTWEPKKGLRLATVVVPYSSSSESGVVIVGKSLKTVDENSMRINYLVAIGLLGSLVVLFGLLVVQYLVKKPQTLKQKVGTKLDEVVRKVETKVVTPIKKKIARK